MDADCQQRCHPLLVPFKSVVALLGATFGPDYEIVLHDVSGPEHFIVAIANGALTGRSESSPLTEFGRHILDSQSFADTDFIADYPAIAPDGRPMRAGVSIIRDETRRIIGFLCINYDLTRALILKDMVDFLTTVKPAGLAETEPESIIRGNDDRIKLALEEAKRGRGGIPLRMATKQERLELLDRLDRSGFFDMRGALELLCTEMGKSRFTIYGDLRAIRDRRDR